MPNHFLHAITKRRVPSITTVCVLLGLSACGPERFSPHAPDQDADELNAEEISNKLDEDFGGFDLCDEDIRPMRSELFAKVEPTFFGPPGPGMFGQPFMFPPVEFQTVIVPGFLLPLLPFGMQAGGVAVDGGMLLPENACGHLGGLLPGDLLTSFCPNVAGGVGPSEPPACTDGNWDEPDVGGLDADCGEFVFQGTREIAPAPETPEPTDPPPVHLVSANAQPEVMGKFLATITDASGASKGIIRGFFGPNKIKGKVLSENDHAAGLLIAHPSGDGTFRGVVMGPRGKGEVSGTFTDDRVEGTIKNMCQQGDMEWWSGAYLPIFVPQIWVEFFAIAPGCFADGGGYGFGPPPPYMGPPMGPPTGPPPGYVW